MPRVIRIFFGTPEQNALQCTGRLLASYSFTEVFENKEHWHHQETCQAIPSNATIKKCEQIERDGA